VYINEVLRTMKENQQLELDRVKEREEREVEDEEYRSQQDALDEAKQAKKARGEISDSDSEAES
jgi:hypothetical protein